jgi:hypothetical protein
MEQFQQSSEREPTINDFMQAWVAMKAKWQAEGNVDSEFDVADSIKEQVENGDITPREGITQLNAIDAGRIQR